MDRFGFVVKVVAHSALLVTLRTARFAAFVTLLLLSRVVQPILRVVAGGGLFLVVAMLIMGKFHSEAMLGGAICAFAGTALYLMVNFALQALAPAGYVIFFRL